MDQMRQSQLEKKKVSGCKLQSFMLKIYDGNNVRFQPFTSLGWSLYWVWNCVIVLTVEEALKRKRSDVSDGKYFNLQRGICCVWTEIQVQTHLIKMVDSSLNLQSKVSEINFL